MRAGSVIDLGVTQSRDDNNAFGSNHAETRQQVVTTSRSANHRPLSGGSPGASRIAYAFNPSFATLIAHSTTLTSVAAPMTITTERLVSRTAARTTSSFQALGL